MSYNFHAYNGHTFNEAIELQLFMESVRNSGYALDKQCSTYETRVYRNSKEKITFNVVNRTVEIE